MLVTGATGFLGRRLLEFLLETPHDIRALLRPSSRRERLPTPPAGREIEVAVATLDRESDPTTLDAALSGVEVVVHSAGGGRTTHPQELYANNRDTTQVLIEALERQGRADTRLLLVSSVAAHGPTSGLVPRPLDAPATPVTHYGKSKAAAETLALDAASRLHVSILRPPGVFGPGDDRMLPVFRMAARGRVWLPGPATAASFVHIDDCCEALVAMLNSEIPSGAVYTVATGEPLAWPELAATLGRAVGRDAVAISRIPLPVLAAAAGASELWSRLSGRATVFNRDKLLEIRQPSWICDNRALSAATGWRSERSLEAALRETAEWYRQQGALRG